MLKLVTEGYLRMNYYADSRGLTCRYIDAIEVA